MKYRFLRFPRGKSKAVTLSCDEILQDIRFYAIILEYGLKCTFNRQSKLSARFLRERWGKISDK